MSVRGAWLALRWPTGADLLFSAKAFLATALALVIGFSQNLENPYWSALTIYSVVSQPQAGAVRSKALFRLVGTLLGGAGAVLLASLFASHVGVTLFAVLGTMLATYYLKTLDRTPASYTWFATSLTLAVIGIVHVQQPGTIFAFAAARVVEISLGILAIGLVDAVLFPVAATPGFVASLADWRDRASEWVTAALAPDAPTTPDARWARRLALRRLAALLAPLDAQGVQLPWDTVAVPPRGAELRLLRVTVAHLLAHLAAANNWAEATRADLMDETLVADARTWLGDRAAAGDPAILAHAAEGDRLAARLSERFHQSAAQADAALLPATTLLRVAELVGYWARYERLLYAFATGEALPPGLRRAANAARPVRSIDYLVSALDVAPLVLALGTGLALWYFTAWSAGLNAMLFAFVVCGFIIGTPGAVRSAAGASLWTLLAFAVTFFYLFVVLPRVTALPLLLAVLAAGLLPLGLLVAMTPAALLITANAFAFLGLQNAYAADFGATLQSLGGSMAGCLLAVTSLFLCQYDRPRLRARRLEAAVKRDVRDAATGRRVAPRDRLLSLSVDRIALFFGIVDALPANDRLARADLVTPFRVLANLSALRGEERALPAAAQAAVRRLCAAVRAAYRPGRVPDRAVLRHLAEAVATALAGEPAGPPRARALAAATGLQLAWTADPAFEGWLAEVPA